MSERTYHHGNLRDALIEAGVELARDGGPEAVVLREVARRVGVSHNAGYRHFDDRDELLREVCARCMSALARLIEQRVAKTGAGSGIRAERARLRASGAAYIEFALKEPGWFRTAFSVPRQLGALGPGEGTGKGGLGPFELLSERLDAFAAAGGIPPARRRMAEFPAWAAVHGLATLLTDGPLRGVSPRARREVIDRVLDNVERGLRG